MESIGDEDVLVLRDEQPVASETTITLALLSYENELHGNDPTRRELVEGHISFNPRGDLIFFIPPFAGDEEELQLVPDRGQWDLYLINLPFALHPAPGHRYYERLMFEVRLSTPDTLAYMLFPDVVTGAARERVTYIFSPELEFLDAEQHARRAGKRIQFNSLRPLITAFGQHESRFYWLHETDQEHKALKPEMKQALVVLQVPRGTTFVEGTVAAEALVVKKQLGNWERKRSIVKEYPLRWDLRNVLHLFKAPSSSTSSTKDTALPQSRAAISIYYSFMPVKTDEHIVKALKKHLAPLRRNGLIQEWESSVISYGQVRAEVKKRLNAADIILLFISPDYLASKDCLEEMEQALARTGAAENLPVVPILLHPIAPANETAFAHLLVFPRDKRALSEHRENKASVIAAIAEELIGMVTALRKQRA